MVDKTLEKKKKTTLTANVKSKRNIHSRKRGWDLRVARNEKNVKLILDHFLNNIVGQGTCKYFSK